MSAGYWEGWACSDCVMLIAYSESPPEMSKEDTAAWLERIDARMEGTEHVSPGRMLGGDGCNCDPDEGDACSEEHIQGCERVDFSWSRCDYCGSTLGGSREAITGWIKTD